MQYVAIFFAVLAAVAGLAAVAFVYAARSLIDDSPQYRREWASGWRKGARRLVQFAVGFLVVASVFFALSFL
jgi:hypothetical protein